MKGEQWYSDLVNPNVYIGKMLHSDSPSIPFRYISGIIGIKTSLFTYDDLPGNLKPYILETALLFSSNLCFYKYGGTNEWLLCSYEPTGDYDYYMQPTKVSILSMNGITLATDVPFDSLILVKDNFFNIPPILSIKEYVDKLVYLERQEDKIVDLACFPVAFCGNKKQANQLRELTKKAGNGTAYILGDDSITDAVKSFNINVPISPTEIHEMRDHWKRECLSSLGIYSADEKRERIITAEINATNDYTDYCYQSCKLARKSFCDEFNRLTNSHVVLHEVYDVNYKEDSVLQANRERLKAQADNVVPASPKGGTTNNDTNRTV